MYSVKHLYSENWKIIWNLNSLINLLFTWSTIWKKILKQVDVKKPKQLREIMTTQRVGYSPWIAHGMWTYMDGFINQIIKINNQWGIIYYISPSMNYQVNITSLSPDMEFYLPCIWLYRVTTRKPRQCPIL